MVERASCDMEPACMKRREFIKSVIALGGGVAAGQAILHAGAA